MLAATTDTTKIAVTATANTPLIGVVKEILAENLNIMKISNKIHTIIRTFFNIDINHSIYS